MSMIFIYHSACKDVFCMFQLLYFWSAVIHVWTSTKDVFVLMFPNGNIRIMFLCILSLISVELNSL